MERARRIARAGAPFLLLPLFAFSPNSGGCYEEPAPPPLPLAVSGEVLVEFQGRDEAGQPTSLQQALGLSGVTVQIMDTFGPRGEMMVERGRWSGGLSPDGRRWARAVFAEFRGERTDPVELHQNRTSHAFEPFVVRADAGRLEIFPNPGTGPFQLQFWLDPRLGGVWDLELTISDGLLDGLEPAHSRALASGQYAGGSHVVLWDGRFDGEPAPPGLYRVQLEFPFQRTTWTAYLELE